MVELELVWTGNSTKRKWSANRKYQRLFQTAAVYFSTQRPLIIGEKRIESGARSSPINRRQAEAMAAFYTYITYNCDEEN